MLGNKERLESIVKLLVSTANELDDITGSLNYGAASELSFATDHLRIACARIKSSIGAADAHGSSRILKSTKNDAISP